ncbi:MAG: SUMF1/EgtB/PvdO family nonheme iron enzyme [Anaerolineae bacterium]|nr:SUMF1/EgtB/PvdO family nonheme iron enzyme [Anaerolineae bacterium]
MSESKPIPPILDDLPAQQDSLDFAPYVDALGDILLDEHTHTPLTMGIYGSWGSGKTSLMTMLRQRVSGQKADGRAADGSAPEDDSQEAAPGHRTVWFNAWKYNQEEALWRALLLLLLEDLGELLKQDQPEHKAGEPAPETLMNTLREALYRDSSWSEKGERKVDWGQALTAGAGLAFNLVVSSVGLGLAAEAMDAARKTVGEGEPVNQVSKLLKAVRREELIHYQAQLKSLEQFQENFRRLITILLGQRRRLVVFVDDLDRCLPEKAVQVLEAIKLFLDVPGCIFVLGLDDEAIEQAVQTRYQGKVKAREYLEKIVQLPFILPPIEGEAMLQYVNALAPALPDPRCAQVFAEGLSPNPRQVKRTLNIFLLLARLVERRPALAETVTGVRLAKLVAIQHAHPRLYELLRLRPGYLRDLEIFFRAGAEEGAGRGERADQGERPALPEALQPFQGEASLRRLLCLFEDEDARFEPLTPLDLRSYLTLARRATPVGAPAAQVARLVFEPQVVPVLAGPFWMGTSEIQVAEMVSRFDWAKELQEKGRFAWEQPRHEVTLAAFEIGRYPVTNAEYAAFVEGAGYSAPPNWPGGRLPEDLADHPVTAVTWRDALAYVDWLRERTDKPYRLPTEAEWEKAARGDDGRLWPWGDDWRAGLANCQPDGPGRTTPVGQVSPAGGDSVYGCADMAGNVWEWCSSLWGPDAAKPAFGYPFRADDGREKLESGDLRILRGGCYADDAGLVRCACRYRNNPDTTLGGFRVARSLP